MQEDFIDSAVDTFEEIEIEKKKGIQKLEDRKTEEEKFHCDENSKLKHEAARLKQGFFIKHFIYQTKRSLLEGALSDIV